MYYMVIKPTKKMGNNTTFKYIIKVCEYTIEYAYMKITLNLNHYYSTNSDFNLINYLFL